MRASKLLTTAALIALLGAGCAPEATPTPAPQGSTSQTPSPSPTPTSPTPTPTSSSTPTPVPIYPNTPPTTPSTSVGGTTTLATTVTIDDTWKTYSNNALKFEFKWPSRGKYAPQWEAKILSEDDASIKDGCMAANRLANTVEVNGVSFCHTGNGDAAVSTEQKQDFYVTKKGTHYIVLEFTKTLATTHSWEEYAAHLDQIVSTFKYTE